MKIKVYKNIELTEYENLNEEIDWSRKSNKDFSKLHSISSYLAMFCPALPKFFIEKYTKENDLVMDNFYGRGTTPLVCRELNRKFIGSDLNPYAYVLSKFKTSNKLKLIKILKRIKTLEKEYLSEKNIWLQKINNEIFNDLRYFYHDNVLAQLIFLRDKLGRNWNNLNEVDNAIVAIALGLMHGKLKKDNTTIYFSIDMPNTISMSPNYVKKYAKLKKLIKPNVNIFENIEKRLNFKFDKNVFDKKFDSKILLFDATKDNKNIKDNSVSLVVTSPPYLSIVDYRLSNWLKLWLLGFEKNKLNQEIKLSDKLNINQYIDFIKSYLNSIYKKLKNKAKVCLVVGDVHETKLIEEVWKKIEPEVKFKFVEIYYDEKYLQTKKITNMLNSKKGKATIIEKVLVLEKYEN